MLPEWAKDNNFGFKLPCDRKLCREVAAVIKAKHIKHEREHVAGYTDAPFKFRRVNCVQSAFRPRTGTSRRLA